MWIERVEVAQVRAGERAPDREALALETRTSRGDGAHAALHRRRRERGHARRTVRSATVTAGMFDSLVQDSTTALNA
jgi:hypothetical protein